MSKPDQPGPKPFSHHMLNLLRTAHRMSAIFSDLPLELQVDLFRKAGIPLRKSSKNREAQIQGGKPKLMEMLKRDGPAGDVLQAWCGVKLADYIDINQPFNPDNWRDGLIFLIIADGRDETGLPTGMKSACEESILGKSVLATEDQIQHWSLWLRVQTALSIPLSFKSLTGDLIESARNAWDDLDDGKDSVTLDDLWLKLQSVLDQDAESLEAFNHQAHRAFTHLTDAAGRIGYPLPPNLQDTPPAQRFSLTHFSVLLSSDWWDGFEENAKHIFDQMAQVGAGMRLRSLVELPGRIRPTPPDRDLDLLLNEAGALKACLDAGEPVNIRNVAPNLDIVGQVMIDGRDPDEEQRDLLEVVFSKRLCSLLESHSLRLENAELEQSADSRTRIQQPIAEPVEPLLQGEEIPGAVSDTATLPNASNLTLSTDIDELPTSKAADVIEPDVEVPSAGTSEPSDESMAIPQVLPDQPGNAETGAISSAEEEVFDGQAPITDVPISDAEAPQEPSIFEADADSRQIALQLQDRQPDLSDSASFQELQAALILDRDWDAVYWLARSLGSHAPLPLPLVELLQVGLQFQMGFKRSEDRLAQLFGEAVDLLEQAKTEWVYLLAAAAVRPALMAPQASPASFVKELIKSGRMKPRAKEFFMELAAFSEKGMPLADELLAGLSRSLGWNSEHDQLERRTDQWLQEAPHKTVKYQLATAVWKQWTGLNGELTKLIVSCRELSGPPHALRAQILGWREEDGFNRHLKKTGDSFSSTRRSLPVQFNAKVTLKRHVSEACDLAELWLTLHQRKPADKGSLAFGRRTLELLKTKAELVLQGEHRQEDIPAGTGRLARAAHLIFTSALEELVGGFSIDPKTLIRKDPVVEREHFFLLVNNQGFWQDSTEPDLAYVSVIHQIAHPLTPEAAFNNCLEVKDLIRAERILNQSEDCQFSSARESLEHRLDEKTRELKRLADSKLNDSREKISDYHLKSIISETEQNSLMGRVENLAAILKLDDLNSGKVLRGIDGIENQLDLHAARRKSRLQQRKDALFSELLQRHVVIIPAVEQLVDQWIETGDIFTAEELLSRIEKTPAGRELELGHRDLQFPSDPSLPDFLENLDSIHSLCADLKQLSNRIRNDELPEFAELISNDSLKNISLEAISWWDRFPKPGSRREDLHAIMFRLLRWLGFQVEVAVFPREISRQGPPNHWRQYRLQASIEAPIPLFGSQASQHDIVLVWGSLEPEQIAQWLTANTTRDCPVTILLFNRLDVSTRRRVIHSVRRAGHCPLIIDTCMLVWLCGRSDRTEALFRAGLAGGHYNPYMPDVAGGLPKEMFFGRDQQIESLWKREGPCIVYGGRQLGKTALLQQVIRRYNSPGLDQYVLYHGLKHTTKVWDLLRTLLVQHNLLVSHGLTNPEKTKAAILQMLNKNPARRILVLLDECDNFLDEDRQNRFEQVSLLRDLMTESGRRFKVVLTGLHSVQRFDRIPNNPLAHFGEPICVGPLPAKVAMDLVHQPLTTLGYRFAPASLAHRILAHTNYHPCLIQLFCHNLVETMLSSSRQSTEKSPPFNIDDRSITQVFHHVKLAENMRKRFDWTLDLDKRYRAIGYTIAYHEMYGQPDQIGLRASRILEYVRDQWRQGFEQTNSEEMTGLLDEMVGLGLLFKNDDDRTYRLRSPNVLRLLGGENEILEELEKLSKQPFEPPVGPQIIHSVGESGSFIASPFTLHQEAEICQKGIGLDLVIGSDALGLERAAGYVRKLFRVTDNEPKIEELERSIRTGKRAFPEIVNQLYSRSNPNEDLRMVVRYNRSEEPFFASDLNAIESWLGSLRTEQRTFSIVMFYGPADLHSLIESGLLDTLETKQRVRIHHLRRWQESALRQWFYDIDRTPQGAHAPKTWIQSTGGWPLLIESHQRAFYEKMPLAEIQDSEFVAATGLPLYKEVEALFNILVQLDEEIDAVDLLEHAGMEAISANQVRNGIRFLLNLDMVIGTPARIQAEPRLARAYKAIRQ